MALAALDAAGVAAMLVEAGRLLDTTAALRLRLPWRRALVLAALIGERWRLGASRAGVPLTLQLRHEGDDLHVLAADGSRGGSLLLVVVRSPSVPTTVTALPARLTPRQALVGRLVADGATAIEAARHLGLSVATVRRHLEAVHLRLGVRRRAELVRAFARPDAN